ncbi:universal stress protein [Fluoribacter gormanii]|uniref:universal stress protein n=1 Tax=Fluoribacter gormanii TaxID=464 RepID=UPI001A943005|nr:universal stress protein [Fluoribacter gormanii]
MIYQNIMVAVDGSDTSKLALEEAIKIAQNLKSTLRIITVFDEHFISYNQFYIDHDPVVASFRDEGQNILNTMEELVRKSKIKYECRLVGLKAEEGRIAEKIVAEAKAWHADLLILGTHGRRGFSHLFLGSVAEGVIRIATMPVLLVRGKEDILKK